MLKRTGYADVYTDFRGIADLRNRARNDPRAAMGETARQFESLFVQMALKSMRAATQQSGLMEGKQTQFYREMYDQQLALELGKQGRLGLADMLQRQLSGEPPPGGGKSLADYRSGAPLPVSGTGNALPASRQAQRTAAPPAAPAAAGSAGFASRKDFAAALWPHAREAAAELGVDPKLLVAQAALETGWGKSLGRAGGERAGNNLFGIKADRSWQGERVATGTLEYVDGIPTRSRAAFRAYGDYAESFRDYVDFLKNNPRYRQALESAEDPHKFMHALQKAGYATDPAYARKVLSIYEKSDALGDLPAA